MATSDDSSSSTVNQNGDTVAFTGQPKGGPTVESSMGIISAAVEVLKKEFPCLEKLLEDKDKEIGTAAVFEAQQNKISHLEKLLEYKDKEIGELQAKYFKVFLEKHAVDRELQSLKATTETDANDPAAGDGDSYQVDGVRLKGLQPQSDQSAQELHSSHETKDANDQYPPQQRAGHATAAAAATTAEVSQENADSSIKNTGSKTTVDVKDSVTLEMVDWLAENISIKDWKPLLRKLGLRDGKIDDVIHAYPGMIREQRYQSFKEWKKTSGSKGTVLALQSAMENLSLKQNIREFCQEFKVKQGFGIQVETDSVRQDFSCSLHELIAPYFKGKFDKLEEGLRRLNNLSVSQCNSLQYPLTRNTEREGAAVFSALEYCSQQVNKKYPGDKMGRLLELQKMLQVCGMGVRAEFKKFVCAGVVGPLEGEKDLRETRADILSTVEEMLSINYEGTKNWKDLTSWLKKEHGGVFEEVTKYKMDFWEKNKEPRTGAHNILQVWMTTTQATEGKLYAWLVQNGRNDIAKLLE